MNTGTADRGEIAARKEMVRLSPGQRRNHQLRVEHGAGRGRLMIEPGVILRFRAKNAARMTSVKIRENDERKVL